MPDFQHILVFLVIRILKIRNFILEMYFFHFRLLVQHQSDCQKKITGKKIIQQHPSKRSARLQHRYRQNMKHEINSRKNQIADLFVRIALECVFRVFRLRFVLPRFVCLCQFRRAYLTHTHTKQLKNKSIENDQMRFAACFCLLHTKSKRLIFSTEKIESHFSPHPRKNLDGITNLINFSIFYFCVVLANCANTRRKIFHILIETDSQGNKLRPNGLLIDLGEKRLIIATIPPNQPSSSEC